jgi:hypothetical protein
MFENRILRIMFGLKGLEVAVGWRSLHNEKLHNLYASPYIIRVIKSRRMRRMCKAACMREMIRAYNILVGKPEGKRQFGRPRYRWENFKMYLREICCVIVDCMHLVQDRDQ